MTTISTSGAHVGSSFAKADGKGIYDADSDQKFAAALKKPETAPYKVPAKSVPEHELTLPYDPVTGPELTLPYDPVIGPELTLPYDPVTGPELTLPYDPVTGPELTLPYDPVIGPELTLPYDPVIGPELTLPYEVPEERNFDPFVLLKKKLEQELAAGMFDKAKLPESSLGD